MDQWQAWELLRGESERNSERVREASLEGSGAKRLVFAENVTPHVIATAVMPPKELRTSDGIPAQCDSKFGK